MPALAISAMLDANAQAPRWSPDGEHLAWEINDHAARATDLYVYTARSGGTRRVVVPGTRSEASTGFSSSNERVAHDLCFAPAGGRFVYSEAASAGEFDLRLDTGVKLSPAPGADGNPAWSPDGNWLAFTSARTGEGDLYLLPTASFEGAKRLTSDATASEVYAAWSPDSKALAYVGRSKVGENIYFIADVHNPLPKALTAWSHTQTRPSFSPDGKRIAFYSNHTSPTRFDLYVMPLGGTPTLVSTGVLLNADGPTWTPDGVSLVFVQDDPDRLSPIRIAPWADPARGTTLQLGTVGNGDLDVAKRADGTVWLAVAAQGLAGDSAREFRRVYLAAL